MKDRKPVQTSLLGIANKAKSDKHSSLAAEASIHEEPGAGKPHAGICAGAVRQLAVLPQSTFSAANSRNAEFLTTAARSAVVREVYLSNSRTAMIAMIAAMWRSLVFAQTFEIILYDQ
jgi:hypothetical protein